MSDCGCGTDQADQLERKTLIALLSINAIMFVAEFSIGWFAESSGLIADSLDMLADAGVYVISFYAVGKVVQKKIVAAKVSGVLQIILGFGVLSDVLRRFLFGSEPIAPLIMVVGLVALCANILCLYLISKHQDSGIHMRASWIFSTNDVIANSGIIISGLLVWSLDNRYPDLIIGLIISLIVIRGGIQILKEANESNGATVCK